MNEFFLPTELPQAHQITSSRTIHYLLSHMLYSLSQLMTLIYQLAQIKNLTF